MSHEFTNYFTSENGFTQSSQGGKDAMFFCHKGAKTLKCTKAYFISEIKTSPFGGLRGLGVGGEVYITTNSRIENAYKKPTVETVGYQFNNS